jgi:hypothetical protein
MHCYKEIPLNKNAFFSFTVLENRRVKQVLSGGVGTSRRRKEVGKECGRVNMVQKPCTHVYKWKIDTC